MAGRGAGTLVEGAADVVTLGDGAAGEGTLREGAALKLEALDKILERV